MEIEIRGNMFLLLSQKAAFWKEAKTLLIGDLHLGKITHFRKEGIAAPSVASHNNLVRLEEMVQATKAERIIFLGDLFHNKYNQEWDRFAEWRKKYPGIEMLIVLGNHDILPRNLFLQSDMVCHSFLNEEDFIFAHHPVDEAVKDKFIFCGHIHPVYCLRSSGRQSIKLPCFIHDPYQMILPSFGIFTGGYEMELIRNRKIYVIAGDKVIGV